MRILCGRISLCSFADFHGKITKMPTEQQQDYPPSHAQEDFKLACSLHDQQEFIKAESIFQKILNVYPNQPGALHLLGHIAFMRGKNAAALELIQKALTIKPHYPDARYTLALVLMSQGRRDEAQTIFLEEIRLRPDYPGAHYALATILFESKKYEPARRHFEKSQINDWKVRCLYCLYGARNFDDFNDMLMEISKSPNTSPLVANLSSHYATNFDVEDKYNFCPDPFNYIYHNQIDALADQDGSLNQSLSRDIEVLNIDARPQPLLTNGVQSAGNLFDNKEASFKQLSQVVKQEALKYREKFSDSKFELINKFPAEIDFRGAWSVKMQKGGHLGAHIHTNGWISGAVYLSIPPKSENSDEGNIEFCMHGADYPKLHENFPSRTLNVSTGDIVMFPSSLFHRTLPFFSDEERHCIAFDVLPAIQG